VWGETTVVVDPTRVHDVIRWLHDDPAQRYDYLSDVTAVEFRDLEQPIEVVWHLRSLPFRRFLRVKAQIERGAALEVPSVWDIYKGADWLERECYDMFGIVFEGHPDLRRILLYEEFRGYPLRKDYPVNQRQPLVPERPLTGTFVDTRSDNKLVQLKQQLEQKKAAAAPVKQS
jgi:NADH-quinone oxidoreductase subunit C